MAKTIRESLVEELKDSEFRAEYEALEPEYQLIRAMLDARDKNHLSQRDLADITGINQADISRIENGNGNPSMKTMKRIAAGLGMALKVDFVPMAGA